jgi:hypothetical protein
MGKMKPLQAKIKNIKVFKNIVHHKKIGKIMLVNKNGQ